MSTEHAIQKAILTLMKERGRDRLYRNNVGIAKGHVEFGLCRGASDIIGWRSLRITKDMVGQRVAQFVALEVKGPEGKPTDEQADFLHAVQDAGGCASIVRSFEQAQGMLDGGL